MATNITKNDFSVMTAKTLLDAMNLDTDPTRVFMSIGRSGDWTAEPTPDDVDDSIEQEVAARDNILGVKMVTPENVSHVIRRNDWTTGTVYDTYAEAAAIGVFTTAFYVMTDEYNVYKCIGNNSDSASTEKPTGQSTSIFSTADGYQWKFMFNVSAGDALNFLTSSWIPVPTGDRRTAAQIAVENAAIPDVYPDYTGVPIGGHGSSAIHELGAGYLMFVSDMIGDELPVDISFRQIMLMENLRNNSGDAIEDSVALPGTEPTDMDVRSGRSLFMRNQAAVTRNSDQTEKLQLVISFVG